MSKRLQVLLDEREFDALRAAARRAGVTVSDYVREAIRAARGDEPSATAETKLQVVREAAAHAYPTADLDEMNAEIRAGYLDDDHLEHGE